jgi:hypothetical protein
MSWLDVHDRHGAIRVPQQQVRDMATGSAPICARQLKRLRCDADHRGTKSASKIRASSNRLSYATKPPLVADQYQPE